MRKVPLPRINIGDSMVDFVGESGIGGSEISNNDLMITERYMVFDLISKFPFALSQFFFGTIYYLPNAVS
jgi:hypothetical protein